MKKLYILPFLLGVFALSSCSTFEISVSDARQILRNITDKATTNGKYAGGKTLTRHSTLSNIKYDLETSFVEEHREEKFYYFDIDNNYFRLDEISKYVVTEYEGQSREKTIEIDSYLYVTDDYIYRTTVTTVNGIDSDKIVQRGPITVDGIKSFQKEVDKNYEYFTELLTTSIGYSNQILERDDDYLKDIDTEVDSFSPTSLSILSKGLVEDINLAMNFRYSLLQSFQTFNRRTHDLHTEEISYGAFQLKYAQ